MWLKVVLPAGLLMLGACSWFEPERELVVILADQPPERGYQLGGSVDSLDIDSAAGTLTARGWHMLTPKTRQPELVVYANGAEAVVSLVQTQRPDVVKELKNPDLINSGFEVTLKLAPGTEVTNFCITLDDKHYGPRLLNPHTQDQVRCTLRD